MEANDGSSKSSGAYPEVSAEGLLGRVANGDLEALAGLYDQFAPKLMGLLVRMIPTKAVAESALQEVFLRLRKEAASLAETQGSLAAWLVHAARRAALQHLRAQRKVVARPGLIPQAGIRTKRQKSRAKLSSSTIEADKPGKLPSSLRESESLSFLAAAPQLWLPRPEDITLVDARLTLLLRAFNQIPKQQRSSLELMVFGGYSESEIAALLGEPLGKVKAGLRAAFTFMRHRQHAVLGTWTAEI